MRVRGAGIEARTFTFFDGDGKDLRPIATCPVAPCRRYLDRKGASGLAPVFNGRKIAIFCFSLLNSGAKGFSCLEGSILEGGRAGERYYVLARGTEGQLEALAHPGREYEGARWPHGALFGKTNGS